MYTLIEDRRFNPVQRSMVSFNCSPYYAPNDDKYVPSALVVSHIQKSGSPISGTYFFNPSTSGFFFAELW